MDFGVDLKTRAEKLKQQSMDNWDRTQRKIVLLRLMRTQAPGKISLAAGEAVRGRSLRNLELVARKMGTEDVKTIDLLADDRTFVDATDGGLLRILSTQLVEFRERAWMELRIAPEPIRLLERDIAAAERVALGRDPETGEFTWATILSPTTWGDLLGQQLINAFGPSKDLSARPRLPSRPNRPSPSTSSRQAPRGPRRVRLRAAAADAGAEHFRLWVASAP